MKGLYFHICMYSNIAKYFQVGPHILSITVKCLLFAVFKSGIVWTYLQSQKSFREGLDIK